ncbi:uncharacterized protein VTP21DRAFT_5364 [Calcarisporiella thermophila]|uniref:uncharacterized protein n=1 Tax=Calcarisporiella thermophila TaxID=911321 RepID=UPI003742374F
MPNNKRHTLKTIKGKEALHPNSRKANQVNRAYMRVDRLEKKRSERITGKNPLVERYLWFRYAMDEEVACLSKSEVHDLIEMYLNRHNEELKELQSTRREGRPKSPREDLLEALIKKERQEYISGLDIPDLTIPKNVKKLRAWDGDVNFLSQLRIERYRDPGHIANIVSQVRQTTEKRAGTKNAMEVENENEGNKEIEMK